MCAKHNIFTIPASQPFANSFAKYLIEKTQHNPQELSKYRLLLPTRRACRLLRESFLNLNDGKPILLPQMSPLGDVDEEDLSLMMFGAKAGFTDIPAEIPSLKRQLLLAAMIRKVPSFAQGAQHALLLAKELCQFMDQIVVEGLNFSDLHRIVPDEFSAHWQITLDFLHIIGSVWPTILEEEGLIDPVARRNLLLGSLADLWAESAFDHPVIAAGATGSIPAVARLLGVISQSQNGQVILPGFDASLSVDIWEDITESHPQYSFKKLLQQIGCLPEEVKNLYEQDNVSRREYLSTHMMLPAQHTLAWRDSKIGQQDIDTMLSGVEYYACKTQHEEALLIALKMREVLVTPEKTVSLITPDRNLAHRVSVTMKRWGVDVDDSAGQRLVDIRLGKFITLAKNCAVKAFDPIQFLSLLKMSLCRFGYAQEQYNRLLQLVEEVLLRQDNVIMTLGQLQKYSEGGELEEFIAKYLQAIEPLVKLDSQENHSFSTFLRAHLKIIENLATTDELKGSDVLWRGDAGYASSLFFSGCLENGALVGKVSRAEYSSVLQELLSDVTVRSAYGVHPRARILGQFEARLSHTDCTILGGLNEGIWPTDSGHDPWMSRPMRKSFGLPATEQSIGIAAHDFVQGFCSKNVVLTRAEKVDGSPSVPSRWLDRLDAVMKANGRTLDNLSDERYLDWAENLDAHDNIQSYGRPAPRPPVNARLDSASVTKIENWLQNPYAVYMHYILKIRKMKPLRRPNDMALRGTIVHEALDRFVQLYPHQLPQHSVEELFNIAHKVIDETIGNQETLRYWWPKFVNIAAWYVAHEEEWRKGATHLHSEIKGNIDLEVEGQNFNLYGTADRIDKRERGYAIIDYKSGGSYTKGKLTKGELPQLVLEAMILKMGGFDGRGFKGQSNSEGKAISSGDVDYLGYWIMSGSGEVAGRTEAIQGDLNETVDIVRSGLENLVSIFRKEETPFYAVPDPVNAPRFNDYEHVSRLKEWAALDAEES